MCNRFKRIILYKYIFIMTDYECDRCGFFYKSKRTLLDHLKKPNACMPIKNDIDRNDILFELLDKKEGITCNFCSKKI